jgi:hypothetical protein
MATLIPPYIDKSCKSTGEKLLFEIFKTAPFTSEWIVLHSLNLSQHNKRLFGEIDFLIMIPNGGIYVLEVKGGDVKCINGVWHFTDRNKNIHKSSVGPFNQARDAMFSLKVAIEREFKRGHKFTRLLCGFACAFPHVRFDKRSVEYESWQVYDSDSLSAGSASFFDTLVFQTIEKNKNQVWFSKEESLPSHSDLLELCAYLRGDFERIRSISERINEFNARVNSYTEEQYRILDSISENSRSLIQGSAGTGKTMIAMESAVRAASEGKKVFLTCYNRLIGEWMKKQLGEWADLITVTSLHAYLFEISRGFDYERGQEEKGDFYSVYLPTLLREMFKSNIFKKFDKIIVDEGQDLIRDEYLPLFDNMLEGGLKDGNWEIYADFERQSIYSQQSKEEMISILKKHSNYSNFILKINCRNTKQVGEETSLISGFEKPPFLLEYLEGSPVEYSFYSNSSEQAELLSAYLTKSKDGGIPMNELVILSPKKFENSCVSTCSVHKINDLRNFTAKATESGIWNFASVHAFKGMEANYILITDISDLESDEARSILYVGMSRAKFNLTLFIDEQVRGQYFNILERKLK